MVQDAYSALECNDYSGSFAAVKAHAMNKSFNAVPFCLAFCECKFKISEVILLYSTCILILMEKNYVGCSTWKI